MSIDSTSGRRNSLLRTIPSIDELVNRPELAGFSGRMGPVFVVDAARVVIERLRRTISRDGQDAAAFDITGLAAQVAAELTSQLAPSLRKVINATGVILHTNLGRAPLAPAAIEHLRTTAGGYTNLEYDLAAGTR